MDKEHRMMKAEILQGEGFKQREIAEMLGVTDRTYAHYRPIQYLFGLRSGASRQDVGECSDA
jgi:hypothetical protein